MTDEPDGPKRPKQAVRYRFAESNYRRCGKCKHMEMDGSCELVQGRVEPDYVCDLFEPGKLRETS